MGANPNPSPSPNPSSNPNPNSLLCVVIGDMPRCPHAEGVRVRARVDELDGAQVAVTPKAQLERLLVKPRVAALHV